MIAEKVNTVDPGLEPEEKWMLVKALLADAADEAVAEIRKKGSWAH